MPPPLGVRQGIRAQPFRTRPNQAPTVQDRTLGTHVDTLVNGEHPARLDHNGKVINALGNVIGLYALVEQGSAWTVMTRDLGSLYIASVRVSEKPEGDNLDQLTEWLAASSREAHSANDVPHAVRTLSLREALALSSVSMNRKPLAQHTIDALDRVMQLGKRSNIPMSNDSGSVAVHGGIVKLEDHGMGSVSMYLMNPQKRMNIHVELSGVSDPMQTMLRRKGRLITLAERIITLWGTPEFGQLDLGHPHTYDQLNQALTKAERKQGASTSLPSSVLYSFASSLTGGGISHAPQDHPTSGITPFLTQQRSFGKGG